MTLLDFRMRYLCIFAQRGSMFDIRERSKTACDHSSLIHSQTVRSSKVLLEYYALTRGAAESSIAMRDAGWELTIRVWVDCSAAKAVAGRLGLGWNRHVEARCLWRQEVVRHRRLQIFKIRGDLNPADALTKTAQVSFGAWEDIAAGQRPAAGVVADVAEAAPARGISWHTFPSGAMLAQAFEVPRRAMCISVKLP